MQPATLTAAQHPTVTAAADAATRALRSMGLPTGFDLVRYGTNVVFRLPAPAFIVRCTPPDVQGDVSAQATQIVFDACGAATPPAAPPVTVNGWTVTLWPTIPDRLVAHGDPWRIIGTGLRRIHRTVDTATVVGLPDAVTALTERCETRLQAIRSDDAPIGLLAYMTRDCVDRIRHETVGTAPVLVHGDARPANLVGIQLVDWEQAGIGPAALDVATAAVWATRFGEPHALDLFTAGYRTDPEDLPGFDACVTFTELVCVTWMLHQAATRPTLRAEARYRVRSLLDTSRQQRPWWNG